MGMIRRMRLTRATALLSSANSTASNVCACACACDGGWNVSSRGVSHRDLKLENLMLLNDEAAAQVKLIDFGFSKIFQVRLPCHASLPSCHLHCPHTPHASLPSCSSCPMLLMPQCMPCLDCTSMVSLIALLLVSLLECTSHAPGFLASTLTGFQA